MSSSSLLMSSSLLLAEDFNEDLVSSALTLILDSFSYSNGKKHFLPVCVNCQLKAWKGAGYDMTHDKQAADRITLTGGHSCQEAIGIWIIRIKMLAR